MWHATKVQSKVVGLPLTVSKLVVASIWVFLQFKSARIFLIWFARLIHQSIPCNLVLVDQTYVDGSILLNWILVQTSENCGRFQFTKSSILEYYCLTRFVRTTHAIRPLALLKSVFEARVLDPRGSLQESLYNFIWFYEDCIGDAFHNISYMRKIYIITVRKEVAAR